MKRRSIDVMTSPSSRVGWNEQTVTDRKEGKCNRDRQNHEEFVLANFVDVIGFIELEERSHFSADTQACASGWQSIRQRAASLCTIMLTLSNSLSVPYVCTAPCISSVPSSAVYKRNRKPRCCRTYFTKFTRAFRRYWIEINRLSLPPSPLLSRFEFRATGSAQREETKKKKKKTTVSSRNWLSCNANHSKNVSTRFLRTVSKRWLVDSAGIRLGLSTNCNLGNRNERRLKFYGFRIVFFLEKSKLSDLEDYSETI